MITGADAARRRAAAGVPSATHDARALLRYADETGADAEGLLEQRAKRVPLQHLLGSTGFRYLELNVGPGVFVPRPESELLVDAVLAAIGGIHSPRVVDLCAGSGAIGLSVAHEHPTVVVDLVESSDSAIEWLRRNSASQPRARIHHADLADAPAAADRMIDVVVSNPPDIPDGMVPRDPEVRLHDPENGRILTTTLDAYRMPTIADVPEIVCAFVDRPDEHLTNLGSKGLGEPPIVPIAAAIANAIRDATGADVHELPISREEMLRALQSAKERERRGAHAAV